MGFSIQLHIVKDQQLVPGRAKGLIENLEEWERDSLLQIGAKALCRGSRPGVGLSLAALVGCCTLFWTSEARGISQGTLLGEKNNSGRADTNYFQCPPGLLKLGSHQLRKGRHKKHFNGLQFLLTKWVNHGQRDVGELCAGVGDML